MKRMFSVVVGVAVLAVFAGTAYAQDAKAQQGLKVFVAQKCNVCHSIAGKGKKTGPLDDVGDKLTAAEIRQWIVDPPSMAAKLNPPSKRKPPMKKKPMSADEIDSLVALLVTLKKT